MELIIQPKYVWLAVGGGSWTNMLGARHVALKNIGIENTDYIPVNMLEVGPFELIERDTFFELSKNKPVYGYGTVVCSQQDEHLSAAVGALTCERWGCLYHSTRYTLDQVKELPYYVEDYLVRRYEVLMKSQAGTPVIRAVDKGVGDEAWSAIVAMAMILT